MPGKFVDIEAVRLGAILVRLDDDFLFLEALGVDIGDAIDSSVEEQKRELDLLLQDREQARLTGIEIALKRIESDDFGYCDECGEAISKKRLLAVPLARMCINCQSNEERSRLAQNTFSRADYSSQILVDD